jgi:hypothetical protein
VVFPASGWEMIPKMRRFAISADRCEDVMEYPFNNWSAMGCKNPKVLYHKNAVAQPTRYSVK